MSTGFFDFSNLPLPYIFAVLSGYVLASVLAEGTSFWNKRESFEKILIGGALGLGLLLATTLPFVYLASFWVPLTFEQAVEISANLVLVFFLFVPLSAIITSKISRQTILKIFGYTVMILPYAFMVEYLFSVILLATIGVYPEYLHSMLNLLGTSFVISSAISFALCSLNLITYQLFVTPLLTLGELQLPYVDMRFGKKPKNRREKFSHFIWTLKKKLTIIRIRLFSKKKLSIFLIFTLLVFSPLFLIQFDCNSPLFTPTLQESEAEKISSSSVRPELVINITQEVGSNDFACQYYELRFKRYDVVLPTFPYSLKIICVKNPSNYSNVGNIGRIEPYVSSLEQVKNLWVTYDENISPTFLSNSQDVKEMTLDFSNVSKQTVGFNITYFQQFNSRNVTFDYEIDAGELQNNTMVDKYEFYISNNENVTLKIPQIEMTALCVADCDLENVEVYLNGNQIFRSVNDVKIYSITIQIEPYSFANITVMIPRQMSVG